MDQHQDEIFENLAGWKAEFERGWLATLQTTGDIDWQSYRPPINKTHITAKGIDLSTSRLMLVSSAGAFLPESQKPFDAPNPIGDYSIREIPSSVPLDKLNYAHDHYDHRAVVNDPQVLIPILHLQQLTAEGMLGDLTNLISFMGYQPDVSRVITATIPAIIQKKQEQCADAVLLVPS